MAFESEPINSLIEIRWKFMQKRIQVLKLIPNIIFMLIFFLYSIYGLYSRNLVTAKGYEGYAIFTRSAMGLVGSYLIWSAYNSTGLSSYINAGGMVVLGAIELTFWFLESDPGIPANKLANTGIDLHHRRFLSIMIIYLWFRFLEFFRVYPAFGQYIRMLYEVLYDMGQFIIIFVVLIFSISHSYFVLCKNDPKNNTLTAMSDAVFYVYMISLGEFSGDTYKGEEIVGTAIFVLATFVLMIVMLNLLIAIISETFNRNYGVMKYKEILDLIVANSYMNEDDRTFINLMYGE